MNYKDNYERYMCYYGYYSVQQVLEYTWIRMRDTLEWRSTNVKQEEEDVYEPNDQKIEFRLNLSNV